jgi:putative DNA primase/helicase
MNEASPDKLTWVPRPLAGVNSEAFEPDNPFTEDALALRFSARHEDDLRYIATKGTWLKWDGTRWYPEATHLAFDLARKSCRADAQAFGNGKSPPQVYSAKTIAAVERMAKADRRQATTIEQWDANKLTFNSRESNNGDL